MVSIDGGDVRDIGGGALTDQQGGLVHVRLGWRERQVYNRGLLVLAGRRTRRIYGAENAVVAQRARANSISLAPACLLVRRMISVLKEASWS
jgi:hypothetical protein